MIFPKINFYLRYIFALFTVLILRIFYPIQIIGEDSFKKLDKVIFAGNHVTRFDGFFIQYAYKKPFWAVVKFITFNAFLRYLSLSFYNIIPLEDKKLRQSLDTVVKKLFEDKAVLIFPEGLMSESGGLGKFHKGVAYLHKMSKAPIVPFAINGTKVKFGEPIYAFDLTSQEITDRVKEQVQLLKDSLERTYPTNQTT